MSRKKLAGVDLRYDVIRRNFMRDLKSQPCMDCGGTFPTYVMDLDHRPGEVKEFELWTYTKRSLDRIKLEVAKCDLICSNCHRVRTHSRGYRNQHAK